METYFKDVPKITRFILEKCGGREWKRDRQVRFYVNSTENLGLPFGLPRGASIWYDPAWDKFHSHRLSLSHRSAISLAIRDKARQYSKDNPEGLPEPGRTKVTTLPPGRRSQWRRKPQGRGRLFTF